MRTERRDVSESMAWEPRRTNTFDSAHQASGRRREIATASTQKWPVQNDYRQSSRSRQLLRGLALGMLLIAAGCGPTLNTEYATFTGPSVNGLRVFASTLRERGNSVRVHRYLNPALYDDADVLIAIDRGGEVPDDEARVWLEDWLGWENDRALIYIVRDFHTEVGYWERQLAQLPKDADPQIRQRYEHALNQAGQENFDNRELLLEAPHWFGLRPLGPPASEAIGSVLMETAAKDWRKSLRHVTTLEGEPEWVDGLEPEKADIYFQRRLLLPEHARRLVWAGEDVLVAETAVNGAAVLLVANGSFLFNYGQINHQHRKLTAALADWIGPEARVAFVERLTVWEEESEEQSAWAWLWIPPVPWIAGHFLAVVLLYLLYRWPIFGRPLVPRSIEQYRFGRHIDALGDLLARTRDRRFARARLDQYLDVTRSIDTTEKP